MREPVRTKKRGPPVSDAETGEALEVCARGRARRAGERQRPSRPRNKLVYEVSPAPLAASAFPPTRSLALHLSQTGVGIEASLGPPFLSPLSLSP